jgi:formylglycine-generating enzyme required for sulfatase activity
MISGSEIWLYLCYFFLLIIGTSTGSQSILGNIELPQAIMDSKGFPMVYVPAGSLEAGASIEEVIAFCAKSVPAEHIDQACSEQILQERRLFTPSQFVQFDGFYIDQYEVSQAAYLQCIDADICPFVQRDHEIGLREEGLENSLELPITRISYYDAAVFCAWREARLPTEFEWEYAARSPNGYIFPWGNTFNSIDEYVPIGNVDLSPIDSFPVGVSWVGAFNMAGNVSEWTSTYFMLGSGRDRRIVKGGNLLSGSGTAYDFATFRSEPIDAGHSGLVTVGFRCLRTVVLDE